MKTSITKLKTSILFITLATSSMSFAKVVAKVTEVKGNVFAVLPDGKTVKVTPNLHLDEKSEIIVDETGSATFYDYYDTTYHVNHSAHIKILDKSVHLKGGKVWIQSTTNSSLNLITANAYVDYWKSEFIASFDQTSGKSQIMVVGGDLDVSNILDRNLKYSLTAGAFTLIDPDMNEGQPRKPTTIGPDSLSKALAEFKSVPKSIINNETTSMKRSIASVDEEKSMGKKGEIIFIKTNRAPASVETKHSMKKSFGQSFGPAEIRVFGVSAQPVAKVFVPSEPKIEYSRLPASTQKLEMTQDVDFSNSLESAKGSQPKYPSEVQKLIDDLKSY